jgi:ABC-type sugar transport system substrate-binding protein
MGAIRRAQRRHAAVGVSLICACNAALAKEYRVAVSNSYIGNEWRVEMINFMQVYAAKNLKGKATLTVNNSGTDAQKQIAVISDMISDKVDAIMINPASDTTLNSVIEEACKQGIVVVSFDQGLTAPCGHNIGVDYVKLGDLRRLAGVHQPQPLLHTDVRSGRKRMAYRHVGRPGQGLEGCLGGRPVDHWRLRTEGGLRHSGR